MPWWIDDAPVLHGAAAACACLLLALAPTRPLAWKARWLAAPAPARLAAALAWLALLSVPWVGPIPAAIGLAVALADARAAPVLGFALAGWSGAIAGAEVARRTEPRPRERVAVGLAWALVIARLTWGVVDP